MWIYITLFLVGEDYLHPAGSGDLPPPQTQWYPHITDLGSFVIVLYQYYVVSISIGMYWEKHHGNTSLHMTPVFLVGNIYNNMKYTANMWWVIVCHRLIINISLIICQNIIWCMFLHFMICLNLDWSVPVVTKCLCGICLLIG